MYQNYYFCYCCCCYGYLAGIWIISLGWDYSGASFCCYLNSTTMQVMLSAPRPSHVIRFYAQFLSIIISTTVARPLNRLYEMVRSRRRFEESIDFCLPTDFDFLLLREPPYFYPVGRSPGDYAGPRIDEAKLEEPFVFPYLEAANWLFDFIGLPNYFIREDPPFEIYSYCFLFATVTKSMACLLVMQSQMPSQAIIRN